MPDWFTTSAKLAKIYEDTFASCTVRTSIRLDKCYHKQGNSVAVRLYVIDKIPGQIRSEEHTSELQSLMRNSYAVFCLKKKITLHNSQKTNNHVIKQINKQQYNLLITIK